MGEVVAFPAPPPMSETSREYARLANEVYERAIAGDEFCARVLGAMSLLASGWRYGDPDPVEPDDGGGLPVVA